MYYKLISDKGNLMGITPSKSPILGEQFIPISESEYKKLSETLGLTIPTPEPITVEQLQHENKILKSQIQAMENQYQFLEDCIAEMAAQVY